MNLEGYLLNDGTFIQNTSDIVEYIENNYSYELSSILEDIFTKLFNQTEHEKLTQIDILKEEIQMIYAEEVDNLQTDIRNVAYELRKYIGTTTRLDRKKLYTYIKDLEYLGDTPDN